MNYQNKTERGNPMAAPGLQYGELESIHTGESYGEIKARRQSNYNILKKLVDTGDTIYLESGRLEVFVGTTPIKGNIDLRGEDKAQSEIILYPFTPSQTERIFIQPDYTHTHNIRNLTIKAPVKNYFFETYDCILKPNGEADEIQIVSEVRDGFWAIMEQGNTVSYNWTFQVQGESKVVDSFNPETGIITLTTNISDSVDSDTEAKFSTGFEESISIDDYLTYGAPWSVDFKYVLGINGVPAAASGASDYVLNLHSVDVENLFQSVVVSMGNFKINFSGGCAIARSASGFSAFSRGQNNGQKITITESLTMEECGDELAGSVTIFQPFKIYGAGGYIHPSIIIKCYGTLYLKNNTAGSWRQYSASGQGPNPGDFSYYREIIEEGSVEYAYLTSNTLPTVIDYIEIRDNAMRLQHDTIINGGFVQELVSYDGSTFGSGDRSIELNNVELQKPANLALYAHATLNNCKYWLHNYSTHNVVVNPPRETFTISGGEIIPGDSGGYEGPGSGGDGDRGSSLAYAIRAKTSLIENIIIPQRNFFLISAVTPQESYYAIGRKMTLKNLDVACLGSVLASPTSTAGSIRDIIEGENVKITGACSAHFGMGFPQDISGQVGVKSASIASSEVYNIYGERNKVLEIGWDADEYHVKGEVEFICALLWGGQNKIVGNCYYGRNIRLVASGGDITLLCFDESTRPNSNIIGEDVVIPQGQHIDLTIDRKFILQTGESGGSEVVNVGNGEKTEFRGVLSLAVKVLTPDSISIEAGDVSVQADETGIIDDDNVVGIVDPYTGKYQLLFTNPVSNGTDIIIYYNFPDECKGLGAWIVQ